MQPVLPTADPERPALESGRLSYREGGCAQTGRSVEAGGCGPNRRAELRPRAALTVDFLKSRRSGLLPALGNELLWFLRRLSWPCGAGRPGYRERFHQ